MRLPLRRAEGRWFWPPAAIFAVLCYVPLLLSRPGQLTGDTLDGLYLDPSRTFLDASNRWDPGVSFGAVVDRTFGATFPMSPFYWLADQLGVPLWLAQRLWMGTILFVAALGVVALLRRIDWFGPGWIVAPVAYVCSPYVLSQMGVQSVTLLSFAALPWLVAFTMEALAADERQRWRGPARIGIVVALAATGSVSAFLGILPGPMLWVFYVVVATREVPWKRAATVVGRCLATSVAVTAWWLVGLATRPKAEIAFARQRDPVGRVATASIPSETIRSLGDWRFYAHAGRSALDAGFAYQRNGLVIALSFVPVVVALLAFGRRRFYNRIYFVSLLLMGVVLSSGMSPQADPEAYGTLLGRLTNKSIGAFLLPTARCAPLVALAVAVAFAAGVRYVADVVPDRSSIITLGACAAAMSCIPAFFTGHALDGPLLLSSDAPPDYWRRAAAALDDPVHDGFGVLEVPGLTVPEYLWGTTRQPVSTSLIERTVALRTPDYPSQPATADLLAAIDDAGKSGTLEASAIAPLIRMMGVDSILLRLDTPADDKAAKQWKRVLDEAADDLDDLVVQTFTYGEDEPVPTVPGLLPQNPQLAVYTLVKDPQPLVRLINPSSGTVVAGSGAALVSMANNGLLSGREAVQYSSTLDEEAFARLPPEVPVVVTDSNRLTTISGDAADPLIEGGTVSFESARVIRTDQSIPIPTVGNDDTTYTTADVVPEGLAIIAGAHNTDGVARPEYRPSNAFDGDTTTLWAGPVGPDGVGDALTAGSPASLSKNAVDRSSDQVASVGSAEEPEQLSGSELVVRQPAPGTRFLTITEVRVSADTWSKTFDLDGTSWSENGQTLELTAVPESFGRLDVAVTAVDPVQLAKSKRGERFAALSEVVLVGDRRLDPVVRGTPIERVSVPTDVNRFPSLENHPLAYVFERWAATTTNGLSPETSIHRHFVVDSDRHFDIRVTVSAVGPFEAACAARLLSIDDAAVPLSFSASDRGKLVGVATRFEMKPGPHDLDASTVGCEGSGLTVETVELNDSDRPAGPHAGPVPVDEFVAFDVERTSPTSYQIPGISAPRDLWLTIGTSYDSDWQARGLPGLDVPSLLNGTSAAWYIDGPVDAPFLFTARWTPQRLVSVGVILSAVAFLVVVGIALIPVAKVPVRTDSLVAPETLRAGNSNVVVLAVLGVFGIAAGAIPAIVAGLAALLLELRPQYQRRVAWSAPALLVLVAVAKVVHATAGTDPTSLAALTGPRWIEVLTYSALALSVTSALANTERPPIKRYPVEM